MSLLDKKYNMKEPNVVYNLQISNPVMVKEVKNLVNKNLSGKMSSALTKIYSKWENVEVVVKVSISENNWLYDWDFILEYDGSTLNYSRKWFSILSDLVNHAFDNFKQWVLDK